MSKPLMNSLALVLKLYLDELGLEFDVSTKDKRMQIQYSVYLGQRVGANCGYYFIWRWYNEGPFSEGLENDCAQLKMDLDCGYDDYKNANLKQGLKDRMVLVKPFLEIPDGFYGTYNDWLNLIVCYDYIDTKLKIKNEEKKGRFFDSHKMSLLYWPNQRTLRKVMEQHGRNLRAVK